MRIDSSHYRGGVDNKSRAYWWFAAMVFAAVVLFVVFLRAPGDFPREARVTIENGASLSEVSSRLAEENIIQSSSAFTALMMLLGGESGVVAGQYRFANPQSLPIVAYRIARGKYGIAPIRVTVPEGSQAATVADILGKKIDGFDTEDFARIAFEEQGYLFPDTYYFLPDVSPEKAAETMRLTFQKKVAPLAEQVAASGHSLHEIITMASLLEKEAHTFESRRMIADLLWRRIERGMPLQVDAAFLHINGKNTYELTRDDLAMESAYNTYANRGLPPGPIANPSLDSIRAALHPKENEYWFYLSDREGNIYYSETFAQHKVYKRRYIP